MTSSTASATPTVPVSLLALTTPFVAPPNCADVFTTVKTVTSDYLHNDTESTLTVVFSDPSDPRFTKCQPQGWDGVVPESRFHFSPAVCPDRWTAYNLGTVYLDAVRRATTAYCCASGYDFYGQNPGITLQSLATMACVSVIGTEAAASPTTLADVISAAPIFHSAVQVHNPYQISWDATDKATLSPTPPDFTYGCTATLRTWIPGESVGSLPCNNKHDNLNIGNTGLFFFVVIGVPIIAVVLIATCCGIYCRKARRIRRGRDEQRRTVHQPPQPVAPAAEPDVHLNNVKA